MKHNPSAPADSQLADPAAAPLEEGLGRSPAGLSVVVPLYDEEASVPALASALHRLCAEATGREVELILVDDGSTDGTAAALAEAFPEGRGHWRVLSHEANRGLTAALWTGVEAAGQPLVGWLDSDLTYDAAVLLDLAGLCDGGADLAIASCHHPEGRIVGVPAWRATLSRQASRLYRWAAREPRHYTFTCMVRVQDREILALTRPERGGFFGVAEQLLRVFARGGTVVELPATLHRRRVGRSKMRVVRATLGHLGLLTATRLGRLQNPGD